MIVPIIHVDKWNPDCETNSYVLLSPSGQMMRGNKAMMFGANGQVVWSHTELGAVRSLQVQNFRGASYLVYWVGEEDISGHGHGYYKMVCQIKRFISLS